MGNGKHRKQHHYRTECSFDYRKPDCKYDLLGTQSGRSTLFCEHFRPNFQRDCDAFVYGSDINLKCNFDL